METENLDIVKGRLLSRSEEIVSLRKEYETFEEIFKTMESKGFVDKKCLGPYYSITDALKADCLKFMMYIAAADTNIKTEERALMELIFGVDFEEYGIKYFADAGVFSPEFANAVPLSFRCLINFCLKRYKEGQEKIIALAVGYIKFLTNLGKLQCAIDIDVEEEEIEHLYDYIANLENYMNKVIPINSNKQNNICNDSTLTNQNRQPNFCSNCGSQLGGVVNFCPVCGMKINAVINDDYTQASTTREKRGYTKQNTTKPPSGFVIGGNLKKDIEAQNANRVFFRAKAHLMEKRIESNRTDFLKITKTFNTFWGSKTKVGSVLHDGNRVEKWESVDVGELIINRSEISYIGNNKHITVKLNQYLRSCPSENGFLLFKSGRENPYVFKLINSTWNVFEKVVQELITGKV